MNNPDANLHPLTSLFRARSIALYGASDNSPWSNGIFRNSRGFGFKGEMYAVNRRGVSAHGLDGFTACKDIPEKVDAAYVLVPVEGVVDAFEDLGQAGVRAAVVLTSGFAEVGPEGAIIQSQLVEVANKYGISFMGPNSLGFANIAERTAITPITPQMPLLDGGVGLISQSGAICSEIGDFARQHGIGLSFYAATGNEAQLDIASVADFLVDDPNTKVIAIFAETIRNPKRFIAVAQRARVQRKPIVMLKVGSSEISAAVAMAHTGSMVGNDRVFDAACRQQGVIRVRSIEDLVTTAGVLAHTGVLEKPGVAVVSISGGGCGLFGDAAEVNGVSVPAFAAQTVTEMHSVLPGYASALNPFDITGAAMRDPSLFEKCLDIIGRDPLIGLTVCIHSVPVIESKVAPLKAACAKIGSAMQRLGPKGFVVNAATLPINDVAAGVMLQSGITAAFGGIEAVVRAIGKAAWWSERIRHHKSIGEKASDVALSGCRPNGEREVLNYLAQYGVPVIPAEIAATAEAAVAAAQRMRGPVALKIASPDIQHKTEVGGVRLNVAGNAAVAAAFRDIDESVRKARPNAHIDGIIVSPMRNQGVELFVGTANDPEWGPVIVVGLGGIWVEALKDTALRLLPVACDDVLEMFQSLRAVKLLQGFRGAPAADMEAIADVVVKVGEAALSLGSDLVTLEINPLRVVGSDIEALDGLTIWKDSVET